MQQNLTKPLIIGLAGPIASGKTTVANFLQEKFGFEYLRVSLLLKTLVEATGQIADDISLQSFGQKLFEDIGGQGLMELLLHNYDPAKSYVIDGIRYLSSYEYCKQRFGELFQLVYLTAPDSQRILRYTTRDATRAVSLESFDHRTNHSVEREVTLLEKKAIIVLRNDDINETLAEIKSFIEKK